MASQNLLALRAELDEQTKEIQKLQKEVEHATQSTINQLSQSYRDHCHKHSATNHSNPPTGPCASSSVMGNPTAFSSIPLQTLTLQSPLCTGQTSAGKCGLATKCNLMQNSLDGTCCPFDTHTGKTTLKDYSSFSDLQRRVEQNSNIQGQQEPHLRQSVNELNLKIQEWMKEKNTEVDMRLAGSKDQEERNRHLQVKVQELEITNVKQEEKLKQAHLYTEILKEMLQKHDQVLQDIQRAIVSYNEQSKKTVEPDVNLSNLGTIVIDILQEKSDEASLLKREIHSAEHQLHYLKRELEDKETCLKQYQERYDNLVNEREQEVAALSTEMNAARSHAQSIQTQLETFQDQNEKHSEHIANLELKVSQLHSELRNSKITYKDKVEELKKQLLAANSALEEMQKEHAQCSQELGGQLQQCNEALKMCEKQLSLEKEHRKQLQDREAVNCLTNEHLRRELIERSMEVDRLRAMVNMVKEESQQKAEQQLASMKDTLQKIAEKLAAKTQKLENAEKSALESRTLLTEKDKVLKNAVDELKKLRLYAEEKKREVQQLKTETEQMSEIQKDAETLKLLLVEKDNMIITLRGQIEAITRMIGQQNRKVGALEAEKSQLLEEISAGKTEIQDVMAMAEKKDTKIFELEELCTMLELEKSKLSNSSAKKALAAKKLRKEREELMAELRETRSDLASLAEDYETLKRNYHNRTGAKEHTATILKMQLKAAIAELEQTKSTMKTVEDCDGHAIKIATRMQKKITAKREEIDTLQSRINYLEEALSNATKDKQHLKVEKTKLMQECAQEFSERHKLSGVVEILKSENNTFKSNVASTEAALDKTLLQLSECQAVIQCLEQETMCLRLQHTLDMKELKGPISAEMYAKPVSSPHSTDFPVRDYNLQIKSHNTDTKSAEPSAKDNITKPTEDVIHISDSLSLLLFKDEAALKLRKNTDRISGHVPKEDLTKDLTESSSTLDGFSREPLTLYTADLEDKDHLISITNSGNPYLVEPCHTSSPKKHIKNQENKTRSPVHSLLTAPASDIDISGTLNNLDNIYPADDFALGEQYTDLTSTTSQNLQDRLECLQTIAKDLQIKNKEMSLMIGKSGTTNIQVKNLEND